MVYNPQLQGILNNLHLHMHMEMQTWLPSNRSLLPSNKWLKFEEHVDAICWNSKEYVASIVLLMIET
jgi:hypothetical protein